MEIIEIFAMGFVFVDEEGFERTIILSRVKGVNPFRTLNGAVSTFDLIIGVEVLCENFGATYVVA